MKASHLIATMLMMAIATLPSTANDYTTWLNAENGYTEVTSTEALTGGSQYYYVIASAEDPTLIVGLGAFEAKPSWASDASKALRYKTAASDPMLDASNYFMIEKNGTYIGLRNVVYSADLLQTHQDAGFMYVNTYTDKNLDEWSSLTPTLTNGYWLFESGKYPLSGGDQFSGYLGPWNNTVAAGEALALNRKNTAGDEAGHFRLFRIAKTDFESARKHLLRQQMLNASASTPIDATWLITNPSFETGDVTGWERNPDVTGDNEFNTRDYGMSGKDGGYLFNAYQWWASTLGVSQRVENVPSGEYELSAVVATWIGRTVTVSANGVSATKNGEGDGTGLPVSIPLNIGSDGCIDLSISSNGAWWESGHESETQTFFKVDNVRLTCKGLYLNAVAMPLPNDHTTRLAPGQWYYHDISYSSEYLLMGKLTGMVCTTDGTKMLSDISTRAAAKRMELPSGRVYFKTTASDATLCISAAKEMDESNFTAVALNVDGLPNKVAFVTLNEDGPGSEGSKLISQYLAKKQYDVLGLSEDFNYHGSLTSALTDDYGSGTVRATLSLTNLSIPFDTDGLNVLWKKSNVSISNESWTRWTTSTSTEGNQYVKKGFRHYDMTIGEGMTIDLYVMHMDAGDATASREAQWQQLANAINGSDNSRPKLIIGDTNSRWTREDIHGHFTALLNGYDMNDAWVELCLDNKYPTTTMGDLTDESDPGNYANYEVVDKIIYLNPRGYDLPQLKAKSYKIEQDYTYGTVQGSDNSQRLGDHRPVVVEFTCTKSGSAAHTVGDVNRDGSWSVVDVMATAEIILGNDDTPPYSYDHFAADTDDDGEISISDVMSIVEMILNK